MNVVAIHSLAEDKQSLGGKLAAALGVTAFEALSRLRIPGNGPLVVAVFAEPEPAGRLVEKLRAAGFHPTLLTADEISTEAGLPLVRRFRLDGETLHVDTLQGGSIDIAYRGIRLVLRGTRVVRSTSTETVKNRSFNLSRAVLSSGLMLTKTTKTLRETTNETREGFFALYAADGKTAMVFNERGLVYDSLGSARQPASSANLVYLVGELRRRCEDAVCDERLLTRAGQAALLGPLLSPEAHLSVATCLLAKVLLVGV
jgi:hypothetical protein